ncbi:MAG: hypothetical protein ACOCRX_03455 [Candidatus Woesearchaeota archaeon]
MSKELKVKCPECEKKVGVGISIDKNSFESSSFKNNKTKCGNCGEMITWSKEDVVNM